MKSMLIICLFLPLLAAKCSDSKPTATERLILDNAWKMTEVKSGDYTSNSPESDYILSFNKTGFSIFLDINSCGGSFHFLENNRLDFSGVYCTEACCDSEFATMGLNELTEGTTYTYDKSTSIFTVFNGDDFAQFELNREVD